MVYVPEHVAPPAARTAPGMSVRTSYTVPLLLLFLHRRLQFAGLCC